jgi:hypothetical protein
LSFRPTPECIRGGSGGIPFLSIIKGFLDSAPLCGAPLEMTLLISGIVEKTQMAKPIVRKNVNFPTVKLG